MMAVITKLSNLSERAKHMISLGTIFFSEFLLIHPFINGNGRTARLLLNFVMKDYSVVPFSLYSSRESYIEVLEHRNDGNAPHLLAHYILKSICATLSKYTHLTNECEKPEFGSYCPDYLLEGVEITSLSI